jgi:hypothetical protein
MAADGAKGNDFGARVLAKRVDLVKRITEGLPPVEYLPESDGMLVKGKRHIVAAPRKEGKSLAMLAHFVRMALEGARIIILDRENGADEYARRLDSIMTAWSLHARDKTRIARNLHYYEFPRLQPADGEAFAQMAEGAAVVVFDSQRMFLTDLGLKEGDADDYSAFMEYVVTPLFEEEVATVILDNTGHNNTSRSRGTSAKGDLNEVLFTLEEVEPFSINRQGKVKLVLKPGDSRFGNEGVWEMHIGGGAFSPWRKVGEEKPIDPEFRKAVEDTLLAAGTSGLSQRRLYDAIREAGVTCRNEDGRAWLYRLAADSAVSIHMIPADGPGLPVMFYGGPSSDAA